MSELLEDVEDSEGIAEAQTEDAIDIFTRGEVDVSSGEDDALTGTEAIEEQGGIKPEQAGLEN